MDLNLIRIILIVCLGIWGMGVFVTLDEWCGKKGAVQGYLFLVGVIIAIVILIGTWDSH